MAGILCEIIGTIQGGFVTAIHAWTLQRFMLPVLFMLPVPALAQTASQVTPPSFAAPAATAPGLVVITSGASTASVFNLGKVGSLGGNGAMIARTGDNDRTIMTPKGSVGLIAGAGVLLQNACLNSWFA